MLETRQESLDFNRFFPEFVEDRLRYRAAPPEPPRLLVAHEDDGVRFALVQALGFDGYLIDHAADGVEVLNQLANGILDPFRPRMPEVIVAQSDLPGRKGLDLLADLRHDGWLTPFVLVNRKFGQTTAAELKGFSAAVQLHEPLDQRVLRRVVRRLINISWSGRFQWTPSHRPEETARPLALFDGVVPPRQQGEVRYLT